MFNNMTRSKLIQIWFTAVALVIVAAFALGASVTLSTGAILLALCLVPPAIIMKLWPSIQPQTIAEVLHGTERR
jgi:hypothetical protein